MIKAKIGKPNLYIDTTQVGKIFLELRDGRTPIGKREKKTERISETLLLEVEKLLRSKQLRFSDLQGVQVNPGPGGFSSTRTGVAITNALNFALGNGRVVQPKYDKLPNITKPKA